MKEEIKNQSETVDHDKTDHGHEASTIPDIPEPPEKSVNNNNGKKKLLFGFLGVFLVLLFAVFGMTAYVYSQSPSNDTVRKIVTTIPYPAAMVNWEPVSYESYLQERDALMNYMQAQGQNVPSEEQNIATEDVMSTLVNKVAVKQYAEQNGVELDQSRIDEYSAQVMGTGQQKEQFKQELNSTFGWTVAEFEERVVKSVVLASQVSEYIQQTESVQQERKKTAEDALVRVEEGEEFNAVAESVGEQFPAAQGGDIGQVGLSELPEDWRGSIESLEVDEHTGVINGTSAYLIFRLNEQVEPETEEADPKFGLSVIVVPKKTLQEVVDGYLEDSKVWKFI